MSISHGHRPYEYNEFIPEMDATHLIQAVEVKQNMYNQGTAALQAKLDQLSSLPLLRDVDKEYANQELSKLYKTVEENAHADFSNPNTVKSFLNMTKPLENDNILQTSVNSTKEFMNRRNTLDEIRKKNPALISAANVDDYMEDALGWFDDKNPGSYLAPKTYTPYIDNSSKFMKLAKALTPEIRQKIIDSGEAWDQFTIERLTKERVSQAIISQLSASELNQMRIDAKFNSKKISTNEKYSSLKGFYMSSIDQHRAVLNDPTASQEDKQTAQYTIAANQEILDRMKQGDKAYVDDLYLRSYMSNTIDGIGQVYAYTNIKQEREENPYSMAAYNGSITRANQNNSSILRRQERLQNAGFTGEVVFDPLTGEPKKNPDGSFVRDTEFWNTKKTTFSNRNTNNGDNSNFRILSVPDKVTKNQLNEIQNSEEQLIDLPAGTQKEMKLSELDDNFVGTIRAAIKYFVGEKGYSDYDANDFNVRFESFIDPISNEKMTKVTVVDDDFFFVNNLSFTLGEMIDYADLYAQGQSATPEQLKSSR